MYILFRVIDTKAQKCMGTRIIKFELTFINYSPDILLTTFHLPIHRILF